MTITSAKSLLLSITIFFSILPSPSFSFDLERSFLRCFASGSGNSNLTSRIVFAKSSSSYNHLLKSFIRNLRFSDNSVPKPNFIVTPREILHIQKAVLCAKRHDLQARVVSGGHDYEGLSYVSDVPFLIIDLVNLRSITIDIKSDSAWIEAGAALGELYYAVAKHSKIHGFPAGTCPTVGVGGHLSGGGFGTIFRKYGLAADQIIDAKIVDVNGKLLDRTSMGEDLFWAIKGGGGSSFGVITAWKVKLVPVPPTVTTFNIPKTLDQGATNIFLKWQRIAAKLPGELFLDIAIGVDNSSPSAGKTVKVSFGGLYLGTVDNLVSMMQNNFTELGLQRENCIEMSWIQSVLSFAGFSIDDPLEVLLQRNETSGRFKAKSDYVTEPIPVIGVEGLWKVLLESSAVLILTPYGGRMSEISESETPFPHRKGNIYGIQYLVYWDSNEDSQKCIDQLRSLYAYMGPYVSKNPRAAYLNYKDLDLGVNRGNTTYEEAKTWGLKYFKHNFNRLARVKARVDRGNFFRDQQSIPPLFS
ncbi:hypothetical protein L6164_037041 [Bauhinia variegata]|uniref:Uncharacterized protein n=1 Tax=Bauhinia variegata TaxID=167791 RepID=A0ACB9KJ08_BAUVA|nr:hypothetical protein L6164_037041 [Bauhinia variegata]